jgi:hypothetical protein
MWVAAIATGVSPLAIAACPGENTMSDPVATTEGTPGTITASQTVSDAGSVGDTTAEPVTSDSAESDTTSGSDTGDLEGPFGEPMLLMSLNDPSANDNAPSISADSLEIYFESDRDGDDDIWVATRASASDEFDAPTKVPGLNAGGSPDRTPGLAPDGLALFFVSTRPATSTSNGVYVALRESLDAPWSAPERVSQLTSVSDDLGPTPLSGGGFLICSNRIEGPPGYNIFFGYADPHTGTYEEPTLVPSLTTPWDDCMARLRGDGLELFLDSSRDGSIGPYSLWSGTRRTADGEFEDLAPVANVNVMYASDIEPWISTDGHSLYFASDRIGTFDLWFATR